MSVLQYGVIFSIVYVIGYFITLRLLCKEAVCPAATAAAGSFLWPILWPFVALWTLAEDWQKKSAQARHWRGKK